MTSKAELRRAMRRLRRACAAEAPMAGRAAARILAAQALPFRRRLFHRPAAATYMAVNGELDPYEIRLLLRARGWREALPAAAARDGELEFRRSGEACPLSLDAYGIPAPGPAARPLEPDLVIAPLLAFDRAGGRLGQGLGCYDRAIARLRARRPAYVIGLAYGAQELAQVPMEPHDQRLDAILTETEFIRAAT